MTEHKQKNNKLYITLAIVVFVLMIFAGVDRWMNAKIATHESVVELRSDLGWTQITVNKELEKINKKLEVLEAIDWKLSKLLAEEYGP